MTNPVVLLGTQSNGETLPVQVDAFGRLVAEGLQGSEGPQGPEGPAGGSFPLPADPYEGALLGWLNGGLAWVGSPPVPIPPGVFGPITAWSSNDGLLTVEGEIPAAVGNGVYVWQCNADGTYFTEGWITSQLWTNSLETTGTWTTFEGGGTNPVSNNSGLFDGNDDTSISAGAGVAYTWAPVGGLDFTDTVKVRKNPAAAALATEVSINSGTNQVLTDLETTIATGGGTIDSIVVTPVAGQNPFVTQIIVDGNLVVDTDKSLNLRVNQVLGQSLLGAASSATVDFTIGKYLRVPQQRVAPWVLYGNDPTSLIDHLRSS